MICDKGYVLFMAGGTGFYRIGVKDGVIGLEGGLVTD